MTPRPLVVFVNRREAFMPPDDLLNSTVLKNWGFNEYLRRFKDNPDKMEIAIRCSHYDARYRRMVVRSSKALKQLREIAMESKKRQVLMVNDKDRPDAEILISMANVMMNTGVWK